MFEMGLVMVIICMWLLSTRSNGQHLYQLPGLAMTEDLIHRLSLSDRQSGLVTENGTLMLIAAHFFHILLQDASSRRKPPNGPSSAVRTSMPAFSSAILRQTGRPVHNAEASSTHEGKNSKQIWR